jgi:PII-like signaling protein
MRPPVGATSTIRNLGVRKGRRKFVCLCSRRCDEAKRIRGGLTTDRRTCAEAEYCHVQPAGYLKSISRLDQILEMEMKGSQLTIYANQAQRVGHATIVEWLLDQAKQSDIQGATVIDVNEGIDVHGKYHAARFFELADQLVGVLVAADDAHVNTLFARLRDSGVRLFYIRLPIEYGELGED